MAGLLSHRGPDAEGVWISEDRRVGLAHRRLSIVDPSPAANQPFVSGEGRIALVFNGEIYNHEELREELERTAPRPWRTSHSDTEVILEAYRTWGRGAIEKFRGMFAFALWDEAEQTLWLVRDRLGIKPLYWAVFGPHLVFASEIKALLAHPLASPRLHEEALFHYLSFLTTPAPDTLFADIKKLGAGCHLLVTSKLPPHVEKWWDPWDRVEPLRDCSPRDLPAALLERLRDSVRVHAVSDVPVGTFLSGGLDSSINTALFAEDSSQRVQSFAVAYRGEYATCPSEIEYARLMARSAGAELHECILAEEDILGFLPRMVELQDEPLADPVCAPVYYLAKLARESSVPVCHVGEGADELFCGYPHWVRALRAESAFRLPLPRSVHRALVRIAKAIDWERRTPVEWLRRHLADRPLFWGGAEAFYDWEKEKLLSPRLRHKLRHLTSWEVIEPIYRRFLERAWEPSPLHWMTYLDLNLRLPELLLMRVDKMAMASAVEARVPFLDHELVEFALGIPQRLKVPGYRPKHLLREAVSALLPREILERQKQGFGVPIREWLLSRLGEKISTKLRAFARTQDILDPAGVDRLLDRRCERRIWTLYNLVLWFENYIAREPRAVEFAQATSN